MTAAGGGGIWQLKKCYQPLFDASGNKIFEVLSALVKRFGVSRMRDFID